jgi:hypothetical protein
MSARWPCSTVSAAVRPKVSDPDRDGTSCFVGRALDLTCLAPCLLPYPVAMAVGVVMFTEGENVTGAIRP